MDVIYDVLGIGIGPFNLGLAAIASESTGLNCLFIDKEKEFNWHAGMMLDRARLQVPYYADLVTLINPRSRFTYMNYLFEQQQMFAFGIHDHQFILRKEYNNYCRWVVNQLDNCLFGLNCDEIGFNETRDRFEVSCGRKVLYARRLVIGVGSEPSVPLLCNMDKHPTVCHSAGYLFKKEELIKKKKITIIGSGQSAAEVFYDLLGYTSQFDELTWFTRSDRLYPMDYSKFALEMSTPAYIDYFLSLPPKRKIELLTQQDVLYKGINQSLISAIYDEIYVQRVNGLKCKIDIAASCQLEGISVKNDAVILQMQQLDTARLFSVDTEAVVFGTGYKYRVPDFLEPVYKMIRWQKEDLYDVQANYSIDFHDRIFVQNAELHTHGFNSADLGLGPYRNGVILNTILGRELFKMENGKTIY